VTEGLVGAGGLSNHPVELMERAHAVAPVAVVQHQYSFLHRAPETDGVLDWCADHDSAFLAWAPLASGFLAGGFDLAALVPGDLRHRLPWASQDLTGPLGRLAAIASRHGVPAHRAALAWVTRRLGTYAIVGARTPTEAADLLLLPTLTPPTSMTSTSDDAGNVVQEARDLLRRMPHAAGLVGRRRRCG
jgi:aryl-alcohol dehydrogenase-like predicted oxidoreductase